MMLKRLKEVAARIPQWMKVNWMLVSPFRLERSGGQVVTKDGKAINLTLI